VVSKRRPVCFSEERKGEERAVEEGKRKKNEKIFCVYIPVL